MYRDLSKFDPKHAPPGFHTWTPELQDLFRMRDIWLSEARPNQLRPPGNWSVWMLMSGRGYGKTRTAAEDVAYQCLKNANWRAGVVARTIGDARDTSIEGVSGILSCLPEHRVEKWNRSVGELILKNGSIIKCYPGEEPDRLRGPQFHMAWADELAAFADQDEVWANLEMATRNPPDPRIIVTTTPRPTRLLRELLRRSYPPVEEAVVAEAIPTGPLVPNAARTLTSRSPYMDAFVR